MTSSGHEVRLPDGDSKPLSEFTSEDADAMAESIERISSQDEVLSSFWTLLACELREKEAGTLADLGERGERWADTLALQYPSGVRVAGTRMGSGSVSPKPEGDDDGHDSADD